MQLYTSYKLPILVVVWFFVGAPRGKKGPKAQTKFWWLSKGGPGAKRQYFFFGGSPRGVLARSAKQFFFGQALALRIPRVHHKSLKEVTCTTAVVGHKAGGELAPRLVPKAHFF